MEVMLNLIMYIFKLFDFSSPEHEVLKVSFLDRLMSVVRRSASCVVRR